MGYYNSKKKKASPDTKSYVIGKITGEYMSQGYSYEKAKHIAETVANRNLKGSFKRGYGSRDSFKDGWHKGHD